MWSKSQVPLGLTACGSGQNITKANRNYCELRISMHVACHMIVFNDLLDIIDYLVAWLKILRGAWICNPFFVFFSAVVCYSLCLVYTFNTSFNRGWNLFELGKMRIGFFGVFFLRPGQQRCPKYWNLINLRTLKWLGLIYWTFSLRGHKVKLVHTQKCKFPPICFIVLIPFFSFYSFFFKPPEEARRKVTTFWTAELFLSWQPLKYIYIGLSKTTFELNFENCLFSEHLDHESQK